MKIEWFNKEHLIPPRQHVSRRIQTYILYFVTKGRLGLKNESEELWLDEGDIYIFEPGEIQMPICASDCEYFYVHFDSPAITVANMEYKDYSREVQTTRLAFSTADPRGFEKYEFLNAYVMKRTHLSDKSFFCYLVELFDSNRIRFGDGNVEKRLRISYAFADILFKIEQYTVGALGASDGEHFKKYKTANAIKEYINAHFYEEIDSKEIERRFSFQYDYVNRLFKEIIGESIIKYKNRRRIEAAKFLLSTTEKEIETIAEEIGFKDPYYFIRYFKRITGCSPTQFRVKENDDVL